MMAKENESDENLEPLEPTDKKIEQKNTGNVWGTVFEFNPDEYLAIQRILDTLRAPEPEHIDPQIGKDEGDELW